MWSLFNFCVWRGAGGSYLEYQALDVWHLHLAKADADALKPYGCATAAYGVGSAVSLAAINPYIARAVATAFSVGCGKYGWDALRNADGNMDLYIDNQAAVTIGSGYGCANVRFLSVGYFVACFTQLTGGCGDL